MARRHRTHSRAASKRRERRRSALTGAAAAGIDAAVLATQAGDPIQPARRRPPERVPPLDLGNDSEGRDRRRAWVLVPIGALLVLTVLLAGEWFDRPSGASGPPAEPSIVIGEIGGEIFSAAPTPQPTAPPSPQPTTPPTPVPTAEPTPVATTAALATPPPTPVPTPVPAATPDPATPVPATPDPTAIVAVAGDPADAVAMFYRHAVSEEFDAAYALWSDRMKEGFPRQENLDGRFDETAAITFTQLETVARDAERAVVQANFVEEYEPGGTREFIGYWEVVLVEGRWLLDQPHY